MAKWGYTKEDGPEHWSKAFPAGKGKEQSPINIVTSEAVFDQSLTTKPFKWTYVPTNAEELTNNGHSAQINYDDKGSSLEGGPLEHKHQLKQFHLHWGKTEDSGSEHRINGKMFASELHLVHWNSEKFSSFGDAAQHRNGLCVLGIFLKVGKEHKELKKMTDQLTKICHSQDSVKVEGGLDPAALLPGNTADYWTYPGSLTTPPLYESVTWVVFKEPIEVSQAQLEAFRCLKEHKKDEKLDNEFHGCMLQNFRPPVALGDRVVNTTIKS